MLLRGGLVADGIGATAVPGDVLIDGPVITSVGAGDPPARCEVIDLAPGSVVCPGFIDAHAHAEGPLLATGRVDGALAQGVTTLVVGQDGQSWIGATAATARYLNRYFAPVNGALDPARGLSLAAYREAVAGRLTQNVAVLASQGTIRHNVAGLTRRPLDPAERAAARREVENALADGAVGLSSGLDYLPSRFGAAGEIADIARPLAGAQRPYVSHLRAYGGDVGSGLDELVAVGRGAGVRVHASHLWGSPAGIEAAFRAADAAGVGISYDMYPYRRSSTILASLLLPPDLQARGPEHTLAALADPGQRAALLAGDKFTDQYLQNVYLGGVPAGAAELAGQPVTAAAAAHGSRPAGEWVVNLLIEAGLNVGGHLDRRPSPTATWPGSCPASGTAPARTASTRASIPTPAATRRSPAWSRTICRTARKPGTSGPPATCRRTPPTSTGCGTGGGWRPAWPPTSASSAPAGSPLAPPTTPPASWRPGWIW